MEGAGTGIGTVFAGFAALLSAGALHETKLARPFSRGSGAGIHGPCRFLRNEIDAEGSRSFGVSLGVFSKISVVAGFAVGGVVEFVGAREGHHGSRAACDVDEEGIGGNVRHGGFDVAEQGVGLVGGNPSDDSGTDHRLHGVVSQGTKRVDAIGVGRGLSISLVRVVVVGVVGESEIVDFPLVASFPALIVACVTAEFFWALVLFAIMTVVEEGTILGG